MVDLLNYSKNQLCQHNIQKPGKVSRIRWWMARLCRKMRCSKVKLISASLIFSIVAGVHLLLSHSEVDEHLTQLSSVKWRSPETKPHAQGETWITGKLLQSPKYLPIFNFSRPVSTDSFCFCSANEVL